MARFDVPEFMVPKSIAEVRELARLIALAEWAPDSYRDIEGNYVQQKIELAIMHGATVGLGPIAAVQSITVIDGMPTIWGDGALSIVERSGLLDDMLEEYEIDAEEGLTAICTMRRRRRPTPIVNRFSMAMAEHARLLQKEGPWQSYPQRMLRMRARSWTIRDGFADVLRGLHIREEVDDFIEIRGGRPTLSNSAQDTLPIMRRPRRQPVEPRSPTPEPSAATTVSAVIEGAGGIEAEVSGVAAPDAAAPETAAQESFALADAEGGFIEVTGAEALRSEFERIFFDGLLSRDQILGLWESNEEARLAIERLFGAEALEAAAERQRSAHAAEDAGDKAQPRQSPELHPKSNGSSPPSGAMPPPARAGRRATKHPSGAAELLLKIDPAWGDQKVFRHYRAALFAIRNSRSGQAPEIERFRDANTVVETRLRMKLPERITEIDAIYDLALLPDGRFPYRRHESDGLRQDAPHSCKEVS
jgi:hypothetical protein